jgi:hypothetical protein
VVPLRKTSSLSLSSVLRALAHLGGEAQQKQVADWVGCSLTTVRNASDILESCGLVKVADGLVKSIEPLPRTLSAEGALTLVSNTLSHQDSFIELAGLINAGHSAEEAARRAAMVVAGLTDVGSASVLIAVALDLGLLERTAEGEVGVAEAITAPASALLLPETARASAQLVLRDVMESQAYLALARTERQRLGEAILEINIDPGKACEDAGKAVENYLRLLAAQTRTDVSACSGLGQVADLLAGKTANVIRPQHRVAANEIAMARNASGHDRDKHTLVSWEKTPAFARSTVVLAARLIASIHHWVHDNRQVL